MTLKADYAMKQTKKNIFRSKTPRWRVSVLKIGFPIALLIMILAVVYWPHIAPLFTSVVHSTTPQHSVQPDMIQKEGLTNQAKNLHYNGIDSHQQPYTLVAKEGIQFQDEHAELTNPVLTIKLKSGETVTLSANKSNYDSKTQLVELIGHVVVTHTTGYTFITEHAWVSLTDSSAYGHEPISGKGPHGDINAQSGFQLTEKGDKIKFIGRPHLTIVKPTPIAKAD